MNLLRFLILIVLTLGIVFVAWDLFRSPAPLNASYEDDTEICKESLQWFLQGNTEVVDYCKNLAERGL